RPRLRTDGRGSPRSCPTREGRAGGARPPSTPTEPRAPHVGRLCSATVRPLRVGGVLGRMKILMLSQFFAPVAGGEERVVEDLSRELLARGHEVAVGTLRLDGTAPNEDKAGVRVPRVESFFGRFGQIYEESDRRHLPPAPDPQVVAGLRRVLAAEQPDVVHAHNWIVHSYLPRRRRDGPPLALSLHD